MQKEELYKLDLKRIEIDIYWELLINGSQSVYALAKKLRNPRSSMYGYVNTLIGKGYLIYATKNNDAKYVEAVKPGSVKRIYEVEKRKLDSYENILLDLDKFYLDVKSQPTFLNIKYYEGESGLEQIVWNTLSCKSRNMYGLSDWDRNHYLSNAFIELHQKEAQLRGPRDHVITKEGRVTDIKKNLATYPLEIRVLLTDKFFITGDTYIYDNIFAATIFQDGQIFGFEIENELFAKIQLSSFMMLWDMAKVVL